MSRMARSGRCSRARCDGLGPVRRPRRRRSGRARRRGSAAPPADQGVVVGEQDAGRSRAGHRGLRSVGRTRSGPRCRRRAPGRRRGRRRSAGRVRACRGCRRPPAASPTPVPSSRTQELDAAGARCRREFGAVGAWRAGRCWSGLPGPPGRARVRTPGSRAGRSLVDMVAHGQPGRRELGGERPQRAGQPEFLQHAGAQPAGDTADLVQPARVVSCTWCSSSRRPAAAPGRRPA